MVVNIKQFGLTDLVDISLFWIVRSYQLVVNDYYTMNALEKEDHVEKFMQVAYRN